MQASSTPDESFVDGRATQKLNNPELDSYISSNVNFPGPEFVPDRPNAIETTSLVDVQTVVEEVVEIKEIDDGLLSELDNVGDFSIKQLGSGSNEFEKHRDSAGESSSSPHHTETSSVKVVEVNSFELNKIEFAFHSENSREHIDIYEEDVECISELQTPETSRAENSKVSGIASNVSDGQDSPYQESSGYESLSKENKVHPGYSSVNHNYEDTVSEIPELEVRTTEDIDAVFRKAESVESEVMVGVFSPVQIDTTTSGMPELEASTIEDIDMAFKQISSKEIEKTVALEQSQAESHNSISESEVQYLEEVGIVSEKAELTFVRTEIVVGDAESSNQGQVDADTISPMPELEANTIKDIDLAVEQIIYREIEKPVVSELPQDGLHNHEDSISGMPEFEGKSIEHVDAVLEKAELTSLETGITVGCDDISCEDQVNTVTTSRITELEASTIEDIDLAFKQSSSKEIRKAVVLEPPQADPHNYEDTVSGIPELEVRPIEDVDVVLKKAEFASAPTEIMLGGGDVSSQAQVNTDTTSGMTELEASTTEDIDLIFKQINSKEIVKPFVLEPLQAELVVGETITENFDDGASHRVSEVRPNKDAALDNMQLTDYITESHELHDSVDRTLHVVDSGETKKAFSELHVAEPITSENTLLPINQVLGGETHKQLKLNSGDGSVEVKGDKTGPSEEVSSVKESSAFAAEKLEHEVKAPKHLHYPSSVKEKGKISKSSSSSSSSSSELSSSDSDKE